MKKWVDKLRWKKIVLNLFRLSLVVFIFILALFVAINIPSVQTFLAAKVLKGIREKSGTAIQLKSVKVSLPNSVLIDNLYVQDKNLDTLFYMKSLKVRIGLLKLLSNEVSINSAELDHAVIHISRKGTETGYNYQYLLDLFAKDGEKQKPDTLSQVKTDWLFNVGEIGLSQVLFTYKDNLSGIDLSVKLDEFHTIVDKIDLAEQLISIQKFLVKNATVNVALVHTDNSRATQLRARNKAESDPSEGLVKNSGFGFPDWDISVGQFILEGSNIRFDRGDEPQKLGGIDYNHLSFRQLYAGLEHIVISSEGVKSAIDHLSFEEICGLKLKQLKGEVELTKSRAEIRDLKLSTANTVIAGGARVEFSNINELISAIGNCNVSVDLRECKLAASDLLLFVPELSDNPYIRKLGSSTISLTASLDGKVNDLTIGNLDLSLLKKTRLQTLGTIKGLPDYKNLEYDIVVDQLLTCRDDISLLVDPSAFRGMNLPASMQLTGHATGNITNLNADASLTTSFGDLTANVLYGRQAVASRDSFAFAFSLKNMDVGAITGDSLAGKITASGQAAGSGIGFATSTLSCSAGLKIEEAQYNGYNYSNLTMDGRIRNSLVTATASSEDPGLNFHLTAVADLREARKKFSSNLDLSMLDLQALHFTESKLQFQTNLSARLGYTDVNSAEATVELNNSQLSGESNTIPVKKIHFHALTAPDSLNFHAKSDLADVSLSGKVDPRNLTRIVQSAAQKYFGLDRTAETFPGCYLNFQAIVQKKNSMGEYFPGLKKLEVKRLDGTYKGINNQLDIHAELPVVLYDKVQFDSLRMTIHGENESISMDLGLAKVAYDSLTIKNVSIKEQVKGGLVHSTVKVTDSFGKPKYLFANEIELQPKSFKIRFLPDGLVLDGVSWKTGVGNLFQKVDGVVTAQQFNFTNNNQSVELIAQGNTRRWLFSDFGLKNLTNIISYKGQENVLDGILSGELALSDESDRPLTNAAITINQLAFLDSVIGKFSCDLQMSRKKLEIDARLENNQNKIALTGQVDHQSETPAMDMNASLKINDLHYFEKLSLGYLSQMSGKVEGDLSIRGTPAKPMIDGYLGFDNAFFNINALNLRARLNNEKLLIDGKGIHFKDFVVEDAQQKKLILNGDFLTNYANVFRYDLHIVAKDFQPVNSTKADNPVFFGKLNLDNDILVTGEMNNPKIEADVKINGSTDLTLVMPGDELKLVSSEGVVKFRDASNLSDTTELSRQADYLTDSIISRFSAIDLRMNLEVSPDAKFRVDINPKSGDYLSISGSAKLNISTTTSGNQSITGLFEAKAGTYQLSFFGLVKKTFSILPGSTVSWSGRPMEADVDITAGYAVRTSSVALISNETSGMSETEKNVFKQRLPYEVKLHIRGLPTKPDINFEIYLPDKYKAEYPLVASKVDKLNTEEMASELNKQVFALLVTGGFIADSSTDTSTGSSSPTNIASTAARNSVNGILADQMNNFSSRYINNVDINFGLTSYEDYGGGSSDVRTDLDIQLSKKLFNDRLTVEAQGSFDLSGDKKNTGTSTEKTNGEVAVIYQLTSNNDYKLKVYYKNIYDLFEGELTCSGMALILEKEFDYLRKKKNRERAQQRFVEKNFKQGTVNQW